jgi:hypothetical protein
MDDSECVSERKQWWWLNHDCCKYTSHIAAALAEAMRRAAEVLRSPVRSQGFAGAARPSGHNRASTGRLAASAC